VLLGKPVIEAGEDARKKAGVVIEQMGCEHRERWLEFLRTTYQFMTYLEPSKGHREGGTSTEMMYRMRL